MNDIGSSSTRTPFSAGAGERPRKMYGRGGMVEANGAQKSCMVPLCGLMKPLRSGQPENEETSFLFT
jgi:hypothetical protein